jgi:hypothetical protein
LPPLNCDTGQETEDEIGVGDRFPVNEKRIKNLTKEIAIITAENARLAGLIEGIKAAYENRFQASDSGANNEQRRRLVTLMSDK